MPGLIYNTMAREVTASRRQAYRPSRYVHPEHREGYGGLENCMFLIILLTNHTPKISPRPAPKATAAWAGLGVPRESRREAPLPGVGGWVLSAGLTTGDYVGRQGSTRGLPFGAHKAVLTGILQNSVLHATYFLKRHMMGYAGGPSVIQSYWDFGHLGIRGH